MAENDHVVVTINSLESIDFRRGCHALHVSVTLALYRSSIKTKETEMSFDVGHTTFGFTMRVPDADAAAVDDLISSHAAWMKETHSLTAEEGKLHTLEYYVSKAAELNDMMDPSKGTTGNVVYTVSEVHKDDEHLGKHAELGQSWDRINEFFGLFEKYSPLVTMGGRITAKL